MRRYIHFLVTQVNLVFRSPNKTYIRLLLITKLQNQQMQEEFNYVLCGTVT